MSFMGHADTARGIISSQFRKKARNISTADKAVQKPWLPVCLLFVIYRFMSYVIVLSLGKMNREWFILSQWWTVLLRGKPKALLPSTLCMNFSPIPLTHEYTMGCFFKFQKDFGYLFFPPLCSSWGASSPLRAKNFQKAAQSILSRFLLFITLWKYCFSPLVT